MSYTKLYDHLVEWTEAGLNTKGGWTKCYCPIHRGTKASAEVDLKTGVFHCFSCDLILSPEALYSRVMGVSILEAAVVLTEFRKAENLIVKEDETCGDIFIPTNKFLKLAEGWEPGPLVRAYCEKRGIPEEVARMYGLVDHPKNECVTLPYWWGGKISGLKYRTHEGSKFAEPGSFFGLFGLEHLEGWTGPVVICEGESDTLRVASVMGDEARVVGTSGVKFETTWAREFDGIDEIIVVPQCDEPSKKLVSRLTEAFNGRLKVHRLNWKRAQMGKDVCDWLVWNNGEDLKKNLLGYSVTSGTPRRPILGVELEKYIPEDEGELIGGLISRREVVLVAGPPKARKTWLALNLMKCLMSGGCLFGVDRFGCTGGHKVGLVEEEGAYAKLVGRCKLVFGEEEGWRDKFSLAYKLGVKLDDQKWLGWLSEWVDREELDVLFLDPLQRLHGGDENQSGKDGVGPVYDNIARLTSMYPRLTVVVLHHMRKGAEAGWDGVRGSNRTTGEVDTAIFVDNTGLYSSRVEVMGRNIDHDDTKFELVVAGGVMKMRNPDALQLQFLEMLKDAGTSGLTRAHIMKELKVSDKILSGWLKDDKIIKVEGKDMVLLLS